MGQGMSSLAQMSFGPPEPPYEEIGCFGLGVGVEKGASLGVSTKKMGQQQIKWTKTCI